MYTKIKATRTKSKTKKNRSLSSLSLSPCKIDGIKIFRVNPKVLEQIKNCEELYLNLDANNEIHQHHPPDPNAGDGSCTPHCCHIHPNTAKNSNHYASITSIPNRQTQMIQSTTQNNDASIIPQKGSGSGANQNQKEKQQQKQQEVSKVAEAIEPQRPKLVRMTRKESKVNQSRNLQNDQQQQQHQHPVRPHDGVRNYLQNQQENRALSFQIRNERIDNARQRRYNLRNGQLQKLEENLRRKEQQRLDHLSLKKKEDRQMMIITTIILVSKTYRWLSSTPKIIEEYRYTKSLNDAARKIQTRWKKEMFSRRAMEARLIKKKLKKISWRVQLWSRCARRRLNARIIRQLFLDFSSNPIPYLIYRFRCKVMKAQKMIRSFIECKRAKLIALEHSWAELEKEIQSESFSNKLRRRKNALSEITHRKILNDHHNHNHPTSSEKSSSFINVVTEVLQRPNSATSSRDKTFVDLFLCRTLCRFHLEDSRRAHVKKAGAKEVQSQPTINRNHAILLLSGEEINLNVFPLSRRWPIFSLFCSYKDRLKSLIREVRFNDHGARNKVEERLKLEALLSCANQYAAAEPDSDGRGNDCGDFQGEEYYDDITKELRVMFQLIDLDDNDQLSCTELGKMFEVLGFEKDKEPQQKNMLDKTLNGELDFETFCTALKNCSKKNARYSKETVLRAFEYFGNKDKPGEITGPDLLCTLQSYEGKWDEKSASSMIRNAGLSTGKNINYSDFVSTLYSVWACRDASEILNLDQDCF